MASSDPRLENDQQSPIKIGPKVKRPRISTDTENSCIIWLKSDKLKLTKAGEKGINTLKAASQVRKDDHMQLHGDIYYHKTCYTSYCSQQNLKYVNPTTEGASDHSTCTTRSTTSTTEWSVCVICAQKQKGKDRALHKIVTKVAEQNLKEAARRQEDKDMLRKIDNEELIACEVLYHISCLSYLFYITSHVCPTISIFLLMLPLILKVLTHMIMPFSSWLPISTMIWLLRRKHSQWNSFCTSLDPIFHNTLILVHTGHGIFRKG